MWQKRIAVAASVLMIAAASSTLFFLNEKQTTASRVVAQKGSSEALDNPIENDASKPLAVAERSSYSRPLVKSSGEVLSENLQEKNKNLQEIAENLPAISEEPLRVSESSRETSPKSNAQKTTNKEKKKTSLDYPEEFTYKKPQRQSRLLASAYYGNGVGVGNGVSSSFDPNIQQDAGSSDYEGDRFVVSSPEEEPIVTADHHQPIRIGLSVKYALSEKWGVETGLVYSYLRSDITEERHSYTVNSKQKVGYVGIPVAASYNIASTKSLNFYASAGAMIELPVAAKADETMVSNGLETTTTERKLSKSGLQTSVSGRVGAEYNVSPSLGIFVEPGVSYYFDNGSSIETAYSDKPLNFNLNLGVRLTIK